MDTIQIPSPVSVGGCQLHPGAAFSVAIDNKGLWPNLVKIADDTIAAAIYNHPSHGMGADSGVELWISRDKGLSFDCCGLITDGQSVPGGIRMNHAFGTFAGGNLILLASGFQPNQKLPLQQTQVCTSKDGGASWQRHEIPLDGIPFGAIHETECGLLATFYRMSGGGGVPKQFSCFIARSTDGGVSWEQFAKVGRGFSEAQICPLSSGEMLLTARSQCRAGLDGAVPHGSGEFLFRSEDGGKTWGEGTQVSPQGQENAHLLELADGRLLYCFTSRIPGLFGVVTRVSDDKGNSWSPFTPLITIPATDWRFTDCGYPSSVQLSDGTVVTAFYFGPRAPEYTSQTTPWHQRYHMGIARWTPAG